MATAIRMPALGQTSDELRLVAWLKGEGEGVIEGEALFEAESDKAVHEVESAYTGTLLRQLCGSGEMVKAGTVIGWVGDPGEEAPVALATPALPAEGRVLATPALPAEGRVLATPAARRLARERGVDLATITGTGPGGRIESADVASAADAHPEPAAAPENTLTPGAVDQPVPPHRQAVARRLAAAAGRPQFTVSRTLDARAALARVAEVEPATLTHLLLQALGGALAQFPCMNRVWIEPGPRFRQFAAANVGLAIASEERLLVATIAEPHRFGLAELAISVRELVAAGRDGRLPATAGAPAAVSLSNLGMFGVDRFEAMVDPDQTAILAVGRVMQRPAVSAEGIVAIPQIELALSVDHRVVDGAQAGRFLDAVCAQLEG